MSLTFIHTADWQLGKPFARVEDVAKRTLLQQERIEVLRRLGQVAREKAAKFVVVAGDLFDSPSPTKTTVTDVCSVIGQMGVPVYAIPGNHDHGSVGSVWTQPFFEQSRSELAPQFHILLKAAPVELADAVLLPCPLLRRHEASDPMAWLRTLDLASESWGEKPRIVIAHGSVQGFGSQDDDEEAGHGGANFLDLSRLDAEAIDYIALGDWHGMKQVGPKAWYSGTPELDRFPKGEGNAPGHVLCVTAQRGAAPLVEPVRTARFGWHQIEHQFHEDADIERCLAEVTTLLEGRSGSDLLRLELTGMLGMVAMTRLEQLLDSWQARLLRLKLANQTQLAPSADEMADLTRRVEDPLIARVASRLMDQASGEGDQAVVARTALRELHAACAG